MTQQDVAQSMLISLTGTGQTAPNEWLNLSERRQLSSRSTNAAPIVSPRRLRSRARRSPSAAGNASQLLGNVANFQRDITPAVIGHYNIQPVYDIYANTDQRDLGGVAGQVHQMMHEVEKNLPVGTTLALRGQVQTMSESFTRLGIGIVFAILLVYLLMTVNFQSWLDPFIILTSLPLGFAGVLWMLFLTGTTFSVPSLMGAVMTIGWQRRIASCWSSSLTMNGSPARTT